MGSDAIIIYVSSIHIATMPAGPINCLRLQYARYSINRPNK